MGSDHQLLKSKLFLSFRRDKLQNKKLFNQDMRLSFILYVNHAQKFNDVLTLCH
jgi:hypothetical protein